MKFKDLREANLSKAQINKVHDKADDLPKSDFIKRYGKEGDAVRFATATNIVKKQLGIDEESRGVGTSRGRGGLRSVPTSRGDAIPISLPIPGETPGGMVPGTVKQKLQNMELDKEDEKSVGRVVKGLKKAVKAHQGQVDALTKDIKDEVAPVARAKTALDVAVAKKSAKAAAAVKQKTKDKADVQRLLDRQKRLRAVARRNEEVELDEVHFSNRGETPAPKGMHKLRSGRDIPSSPQVDKIHKKVVKMTDRNDHFGAKIEIAKACGDKKLVQIYNALELMHDKYGVVGNKSIELRQIFEPVLNNAIDRKFGKYADVIRDAT